MAWRDWFARATPLRNALDRGLRKDADLRDELRRLGDYPVRSRADAEAICDALDRLASDRSGLGGDSALHAVAGLFQDVSGSDTPAFRVLQKRGIPKLIGIVDEAVEGASELDENDILFFLKILVMYGTRGGTDAVIRAARRPFKPDGYMWSIVLGAYSKEHPETNRLLRALRDPLPTGFLAVSLLDAANALILDGARCPHPFDSDAGVQRLEEWLTDTDPEHFSYAVSAAAALGMIEHRQRDRLLEMARTHPGVKVRLEAGWAAAKLGREDGVADLQSHCLEVNLSDQAKRYLTELGRSESIPPAALDPDFQARADFAQWLAHPNELGRPPDDVRVLDKRELAWPPDGTRKRFWLIEYRVRDATGLRDDDLGAGVVGSMTFCFFTYGLEQRPPEDAYAVHCYWEMEAHGLISEADVDEGSTEYDHMLRQWKDGNGGRIVSVAELSPELRYPQRLVALARADHGDQPGWAVLDGPRSHWYADAELPTYRGEAFSKTVLMMHVGRELLGFREQPDRRKYLRPPTAPRPPEHVIAVYERLLEQARQDPGQAETLLGDSSPLGWAFDDYAAALSTTRGISHSEAIAVAYESLLAIVNRHDPAVQGKLLDNFAPVGQNFEAYADALIDLGRQAELPALVELFRPHWDHNLGYGTLGTAAFKGGYDELAVPFFLRLRESPKIWCSHREARFLAEIWHRQGLSDEARALLIEALRGVVDESRSATYSDTRKQLEESFQNHRSTYLRLFPARGEMELTEEGIPTSTVRLET